MDHVWLHILSYLNPREVKKCACLNQDFRDKIYSIPFVRTYWPMHTHIRSDVPLSVCCQSCGALEGAMAYYGPTCFACVRRYWHASARVPHSVWLSDGWWHPRRRPPKEDRNTCTNEYNLNDFSTFLTPMDQTLPDDGGGRS